MLTVGPDVCETNTVGGFGSGLTNKKQELSDVATRTGETRSVIIFITYLKGTSCFSYQTHCLELSNIKY